MGLIKAGLGAVGGNLADQWKEYFYCEAMPENVIAVKGEKRIGGRTSNTKGTDNIISRGSVIAVADGQFMMIVEQGKVVEVCAEPGEFIFDNSTEPSIFAGEFGESLKESFRNIGKRFTFGGEPPKDQRVYYFNTKELVGNKYGTAGAIPFRVVDKNVGLDVDIAQRIIDFTSGSCFAISGNLQKISHYIFIITPASVDISGDFQDIFGGAGSFEMPINNGMS